MAYEEMKAQKKSSKSSSAKSALGSALDSLAKPKTTSTKKSTGTRKSTAKSSSNITKNSGTSRKKSSKSSTGIALPIVSAVVGTSTKSKNTNKKEKQNSTKSNFALVLIVLFLAIGLAGGFFAAKFLCKNDVYEMVAYSNGEVDITIGEDVENYTELGVKCVAFGKDYSEGYKVDYFYRNSLTEDEVAVSEVGEKGAGIYYAVYTAPTLKYKTVKLIRNIIVLRGEDDE